MTVRGISSSDEAKIGGMHAGDVDLDRQVAALRLHHAACRLSLRILDRNASLSALDEADEEHRPTARTTIADTSKRVHSAGPAAFEQLGDVQGKRGNDARHDDERHAVADSAAGDLLANPHQEQGSAD
jgi:hypothetical protein